jgi:hypothetical protein
MRLAGVRWGRQGAGVMSAAEIPLQRSSFSGGVSENCAQPRSDAPALRFAEAAGNEVQCAQPPPVTASRGVCTPPTGTT